MASTLLRTVSRYVNMFVDSRLRSVRRATFLAVVPLAGTWSTVEAQSPSSPQSVADADVSGPEDGATAELPTTLEAPDGAAVAPDVPASASPPASGTPVATLGPPAPAPTAAGARYPIRAYGMLWSSVFATQGVQSYGMPTAVAPTAAVNPALLADPDRGLLSFQVQQTRVGIAVGEGRPVGGTLEVDFVHFDQSSPTVQAYPRIRIAQLEWRPTERQRVFLGQSWDLFGNTNGPLLSYSHNLVGTLFQAGNVGFMRHQVGWSGRFGDAEVAAAVGMQGANTGPVYNAIEQGHTPTGSVRFMWHLPAEHGVVGASVLGTSLRFTDPAGDVERRMALGGVVFSELRFDHIDVRGEAYVAQNLANLGVLDLAQGRFGADVQDLGGFVTFRYTHGDHALTAMVGGAVVLHPSDVVPGYVAASAGPPTVAAAPNLAAGPGITRNVTAHIGYWYSPARGFSLVAEPFVYATRFALAASDAGVVPDHNVSWGGSIGGLFSF